MHLARIEDILHRADAADGLTNSDLGAIYRHAWEAFASVPTDVAVTHHIAETIARILAYAMQRRASPGVPAVARDDALGLAAWDALAELRELHASLSPSPQVRAVPAR